MTKLILIRHGRTRWNAEMRYMGSTDIDLDDEGLAQAERLKLRIKEQKVHKVYASDLRRAYNFATILFGGMAVEKLRGLREMSFGVLEGMTYEEAMKRHPELYGKWLKDMSVAMPGGESMPEFKKRVLGALKTIVSGNPGRTIAVVTHGGPISVITNEVSPAGDFWDLIPEPAGMRIVEF